MEDRPGWILFGSVHSGRIPVFPAVQGLAAYEAAQGPGK